MNTSNGDDNKYAIKTLDEDSPLPSQQTLSSKTELSHLLYNKYVYVREDFRNRKSNDLPSNEDNLWKDQSDSSESIGEVISLQNKTHPTSSTVHFHLRPTDEDKNGELSRSTSMPIFEKQTFITTSKETSFKANTSRGTFKKRTDEYLETVNVPLKLSAVDMVSEHTNKHSSKLMVTKNSFILHQRHKYSESVPQDLNESDEAIEMNDNKDNLVTTPFTETKNPDIPSPTPKNKPKPTTSASSILFNLLPIDEVRSYKSTNLVELEPRNTTSKRRRKSNDNGDTPIATMPSKLSLATDSLELMKRKSSAKLPKSGTKIKPKTTKDDNKSLVLMTQNLASVDEQSVENSSTSSDPTNTNKYEDMMNLSDANKIKTKKYKTSRVAIIEDPVNVIHPDSMSNSGATKHLADFNAMNPFSLNHLDVIDKQDVNEPNKYYYPLRLQQKQQQELHQSTSNNSNRLTRKNKTKNNSKKSSSNIVTGITVDNTNLTPQEFIETRNESLKKFQ
ncbi:origin recognition complex subunit 1-like isoform X3 [Chrysoperla carnea]|uniref:origin recognition complex subunit 1-like isoform X3 n=1 Tax=Chrysoperla carnea TaxID=189513 RepID=UPI001D07A74D|nr:origin recognition complex subunit 1-like isoform X3 [Chrysoperla carnea]